MIAKLKFKILNQVVYKDVWQQMILFFNSANVSDLDMHLGVVHDIVQKHMIKT